jgi:hypothetical protein
MIETLTDYNNFKSNNSVGDLILHVIPFKDGMHPAINSSLILFVRNILTGKTYYFSFNHPDSKSTITPSIFINDFLVNNKNKIWVLDKKSFTQVFKYSNVYDANLMGYLQNNSTLELDSYETPAHYLIRKNSNGIGNINLAIPILKHKEMFDEMSNDITAMLEGNDVDSSFINFNDVIIDTLGKLESQGIFVDKEKFNTRFKVNVGEDGLVYSQYNVYTSTGRPSNSYDNVNYSAINHTDGTRKCFVSRYKSDGRMVLIDYTTFHPRIICHLTNYNIPLEVDIYEYLAKLYFHKSEVDETDVKNSKQLTFRQFFGGVEDEYSHIKYLSNLKSFINEQWTFFKNNGYVLTPIFKRKITDKHILDPNPPKVFNYILQAVEGEISISRLKMVMDYLQNKKTKPVLYIYDAILYDFNKEDGYETLNDLRNIMSLNGIFPMKTYVGESYHDVKLVSV